MPTSRVKGELGRFIRREIINKVDLVCGVVLCRLKVNLRNKGLS